MKYQITLPIFLSLCFAWSCGAPKTTVEEATASTAWAKPKAIDTDSLLKIEWLSPNTEEIEAFDNVVIELKAKSVGKLDETSFAVELDGLRGNAKGGELVLPKKDEYIFRTSVSLNRESPINVIVVRVTDSKGRVKESKPLFVRIANEIRTKITWSQPNLFTLRGDPFICETERLAIGLNIETVGQLNLGDVAIFYNSRKLTPSGEAKLTGENGRFYFSDQIPVRDEAEFQNVFVTVAGQPSETLKFTYSPLTKPNLHVISIGVQRDLDFASKDAADFADLFAKQSNAKNRLFETVNVHRLLGLGATKTEIEKTVERLVVKQKLGEIKSNDLVVLFLSSHGYMLDQRFFIQGNDYDPTAKLATSVDYQSQILDRLDGLNCKKLIFIDACHSGGIKGAKDSGADPADVNLAIVELNRVKNSLVTVTSSREEEASYENKVWQNGSFTEAILEGLGNGKADADGNKIVSLSELYKYLDARVPQLVSLVLKKPQHPRIVPGLKDLRDIPLFVTN